MKGNKTKIASMILAASVAFMASACTVEFTGGDRTSNTEQISEEISEEDENHQKYLKLTEIKMMKKILYKKKL